MRGKFDAGDRALPVLDDSARNAHRFRAGVSDRPAVSRPQLLDHRHPDSDDAVAGGGRELLDVSLSAAGHDAYAVGISRDNRYSLVSGTSAAAPAFAGIMAIVNQAAPMVRWIT